MSRKFLVTMVLCAVIPLAVAFKFIYGLVASVNGALLTGELMQESSRSAETINSALYNAVKVQDMLAGIVAASAGGKSAQAAILNSAAENGDYKGLCFMDGERALKVCARGGSKDALPEAAMRRYAAGIKLQSVHPWQFVDAGEGLKPVLISRVPGKQVRAAGYLLGVLDSKVITSGLEGFQGYYANLRGVRVEYAAAVRSGTGFKYFADSWRVPVPAEVLDDGHASPYRHNGMLTFWKFNSHAPDIRTCLQVSGSWLDDRVHILRVVFYCFGALLLLFLTMLMVYIMRRSLRPLKALLGKLEEMSAGNYSKIDASLFPGDKNIGHANLLIDRMQEYEERAQKEARLTALGKLAAQVAHDIRSPLAALKTALRELLPSLPHEKAALAGGAMTRISDIAGELIENYRKPWITGKKAFPQELGPLMSALVREKLAQHSASGVAVEMSGEAKGRVVVEAAEFSRVISNLLNNAIEALADAGGGVVKLELSGGGGSVSVRISDNGKGIPPEIMPLLGRKEVTHGKVGGTGIGLLHARRAVENWGGTLKIRSELGKGTQVTVELPAYSAPAGSLVFLLDDDALVHMNWKLAAKAAGADLRAYSDPAAFLAALEGIPPDTPLYVDSELGGGADGGEVAKTLHEKGYTDITMATGRSPDEFADIPWLKVSGKEAPWN